jgi:hypothetical protein
LAEKRKGRSGGPPFRVGTGLCVKNHVPNVHKATDAARPICNGALVTRSPTLA